MNICVKIAALIIFMLITGQCISQTPADKVHERSIDLPATAPNISAHFTNFTNTYNGVGDSVIFTLSSSYQFGAYIEIPVSFRSINFIYAVDFSLKFNLQKVQFDTLFLLQGNIQYLYYYNPTDSTLRFTSNSLTPMINDSSMLIIRFHLLSGPLCSNDIYETNAWLNGDSCDYLVTNCDLSGNEAVLAENFIQVFPNPANDVLRIMTGNDATARLIDINGIKMAGPFIMKGNETSTINTSMIPAGCYMLQLISENDIFTTRVVLSKQ